ncbi:MAG: hypothetical protein PXY39_08095 [archaeon]|nr:hypothetical protein [archaeon]
MMGFLGLGVVNTAWYRAKRLNGLLREAVKSSLMIEDSNLTSQTLSLEDSVSEEVRLNNLVGEAVLQGLSHFGGRKVVESLIYILELEHSVNLRNVVNELDVLRSGLSKMFGDAAYVVEGKVRDTLAKSLGLDPDGRTLEQLVETAKKLFQQDFEQNPNSD